ncbi:MAG: tetratricopeptide repeat protein [Polyangiaceae bacterium]|nr:tetratricopeptide repeat protein [Polyangiaceae bacterium]
MRRFTPWIALVAGACLVQTAQAQEPNEQDEFALRAGGWTRSVELERAGDITTARELLLRAWGPSPDSYEVTVRLAWLSLRLGDSDRAIAWYQRAMTLPGAGPEAKHGLASATVQRGFAQLRDGNRNAAREDFRATLAMEPDHAEALHGLDLVGPASHVDPELWLGVLHHSLPNHTWTSGAAFAHVPWQLNDQLRLRFAYRYVGTNVEQQLLSQPPSSRGPGGRRPTTGVETTIVHQHELYAGMGFTTRYLDAEGLGIAVFPPEQDVALGVGTSLRLGTRFGLVADAAALHRTQSWNRQLAPGLYVWPWPAVGLAAGFRYTSDHVDNSISGWAGLSVASARTELHLHGHLGTERWAFSAAQPAIFAIDAEATAGFDTAVLLPLGRSWRLGLQAQFERLRQDDQDGSYMGASVGLRWSPALQRGTKK